MTCADEVNRRSALSLEIGMNDALSLPAWVAPNRRILIVDGELVIHDDLRKALTGGAESFEIDSARQGREALEKVQSAIAGGHPYALAFVDIQMSPGQAGVETIRRLREVDPHLQTVICMGYPDDSWSDIPGQLGQSDSLILKRPFHHIEVTQLAHALTRKWLLERQTAARMAELSHEIRTPMNGVIGFTQLALGTKLNDDQEDYLRTVEHSAESLMRIINDILDFSKMEAGRMELDCRTFSLRECVDNAVKTLYAIALEKGLTLGRTIDAGIPEMVAGDPLRVRQVLLNLIGNAVKFTDSGFIQVGVSVKPTRDGSLLAEFQVRDSGIGIARDQQALIFEPFRQGNHSMARKYGGTGLGLAISSNLVRLMGGRIWLESEAGKGSTFHFTTRFEAQAPAQLEEPSYGAGYETNRPLSILLAEDDPASRALVASLLKAGGHRLRNVGNGLQALSAMAQEVFDVVLMDLQMPGMDGLEATAEIRKRERETGGHTPIVALTAHALRGDRQRCLEAGMDGYVSKPIRARDLLAAIALATRPNSAMEDRIQ